MLTNGKETQKKQVKGPLYYGSVLAFIAGLLLLIAFCSPHWLESYEDAYLPFQNMGLWQFCFDNFHYYKQQENVRFSGCQHVFSFEYRAIRQWLLPGWLQIVQACVSVSLLFSVFGQLVLALVAVKWPLSWWQQHQYELVATAFVSTASTVLLLFLALLIFGAKSWDYTWLMYPHLNYFSWSFYMAYLSLLLHAIAACLLFMSALYLRRVRHLRPRAVPMRATGYQRSSSLASYQYRCPSSASVPSVAPSSLAAAPPPPAAAAAGGFVAATHHPHQVPSSVDSLHHPQLYQQHHQQQQQQHHLQQQQHHHQQQQQQHQQHHQHQQQQQHMSYPVPQRPAAIPPSYRY